MVSVSPDFRPRGGPHFKGPIKPWTTDAMLRWAHGDDMPAHRPAGALFRRWYDACVDVLARTHLRTVRPALAKESAAPVAAGKPGRPLQGVELAGK